LLANRIYQPPSMCLNQRLRQQAGSYEFAAHAISQHERMTV
jgi:hypothetical protein